MKEELIQQLKSFFLDHPTSMNSASAVMERCEESGTKIIEINPDTVRIMQDQKKRGRFISEACLPDRKTKNNTVKHFS